MAAVILCSCFTLGTVFMSATSSTRLSCTATCIHDRCACIASWTACLCLVFRRTSEVNAAAKRSLTCLANRHKRHQSVDTALRSIDLETTGRPLKYQIA